MKDNVFENFKSYVNDVSALTLYDYIRNNRDKDKYNPKYELMKKLRTVGYSENEIKIYDMLLIEFKKKFINVANDNIDYNNKFPELWDEFELLLNNSNVDKERVINDFQELCVDLKIADWNDFPIEEFLKKYKGDNEKIRLLKRLDFSKKMAEENQIKSNYNYDDTEILANFLNEEAIEKIVKSPDFIKNISKSDLEKIAKRLVAESFNKPEHVGVGALETGAFSERFESVSSFLFRLMIKKIDENVENIKYVKTYFDNELGIGSFNSFCLEKKYSLDTKLFFSYLVIDNDVNISIKDKENVILSQKTKNGQEKRVEDVIYRLNNEDLLLDLIESGIVDSATLLDTIIKIDDNNNYKQLSINEVIDYGNSQNVQAKEKWDKAIGESNESLLKVDISEFFNSDLDSKQLKEILSDSENIKKIDGVTMFALTKYNSLLIKSLNEKVQACAIGGIDYTGRELTNFIESGINSLTNSLKYFKILNEDEKDMLYSLTYEGIDRQVNVIEIFKLILSKDSDNKYLISDVFEQDVAKKIISVSINKTNQYFNFFNEASNHFTINLNDNSDVNKKENTSKELGELYNEYTKEKIAYNSITNKEICNCLRKDFYQQIDVVLLITGFIKNNKDFAKENLNALTNLYNNVVKILGNSENMKLDDQQMDELLEFENLLLNAVMHGDLPENKINKIKKNKF